MRAEQAGGTSIGRVLVDARDSYRAAGRVYGETFAADIARQAASYGEVFEALGIGADAAAARAEEELLHPTSQAYPGYVDELRGRAEGAGVRFRDLFPMSCIEELFAWVGPHELERFAAADGVGQGLCTTLALRRDGRVVIGHNEDWCAADVQATKVMNDVIVPGGTRFLSLQMVGLPPWEGMNSHGLAITANTLPTVDARPGVANAFVLRSLLECRTLEEVWERVRLPQRAIGTYVVAGDARGRVWAMETSALRASRRVVKKWTIEANHFTHEAMLPMRALPILQDSLGRLTRARTLVSAGLKRREDLSLLAREVLTDHLAAGGRSICGHAQQGVALAHQLATVKAVIYEPTARRMWASAGPACENPLELFELTDAVG